MGVRRAVDIVLKIAQQEKSRRIYTYGPLIHNPQTIELLKSRGINPIENIDEIEDKKNAILIIRAHGVAPAERIKLKESGIRVVNATCPKVGYVQSIIKKHTALNYTVVIVGDKEHPEVDGLLGYTGGRGIIIPSLEEVNAIPCLDKVCVVAQTTQNLDDYNRVVEKIKAMCPQAVVFNTICSSTEQRQAEIIDMAAQMDAMFIVGGRNSANTRRLAGLAQQKQPYTFHIETPTEIENIDLGPFNRIGISAGASTPNWIINRVIDKITEGQGRKIKLLGKLFSLWISSVRMDIYSSIGAGCLCLACVALQNVPIKFSYIAISSLFLYATHVLNRLISRKPLGLVGSFREETYLRHEKLFFFTALAAIAASLVLAFHHSLIVFSTLFAMSLAGLLYHMKILPKSWKIQSLRDLPGSKNILMSIAWGMTVAVLPAIDEKYFPDAGLLVSFLFAFGIVFIRSSMADILAIQSDKLIGKETIPVLFGKTTTLNVLKVISLILFTVLLFSYPSEWTSSLSFLLIACVLYLWICFMFCDKKPVLSEAVKEGLLETSYVLAGFCVLLWRFFIG